MRALFLALCACACALLCLCTITLTGGTSSSENAKVQGTIIDTLGAPASDTRVLLVPAAFNPAEDAFDSITRDTTDAGGAYSFDNVAPGIYNIQASNPVNGTSLLITGIELKKKDSLTVSTDTLKLPGTIIIVLNDTPGSIGVKVYIPGTTRFESVPAAATFVTLDSVPCGSIPIVLIKDQSDTLAVTLGSNITVLPADTTYLSMSAKLFLNTTSTGAHIQAPVTHFPLLVRLTAADFDFAQFRPDGGDIRFKKADGTPLKYEIAQWDTALKQAAIWVSVDTVLGNSTAQFITMTWGYLGAASASNSAGVFDTAFGFSAVWHLEESTTAQGIMAFKDATRNSADGANFIQSVDRDGIAGTGRHFNGTDYILVSKQIVNIAADDFTIALWLNPLRERGPIVSKDTAIAQDSCAKRLFLGDAAGDSSGLHPSFGGKGSGVAVSDAALLLNTWHHIVFSWDQASKTASFFVDGVKTGMQTNTFSAACPDNPKDRIIIGYDGTYLFGYCDEIHISGTARSEDWARLSYENQRAGQKLISIVK